MAQEMTPEQRIILDKLRGFKDSATPLMQKQPLTIDSPWNQMRIRFSLVLCIKRIGRYSFADIRRDHDKLSVIRYNLERPLRNGVLTLLYRDFNDTVNAHMSSLLVGCATSDLFAREDTLIQVRRLERLLDSYRM